MASQAPAEKIKLGWFSFSCCEDNTIVMTEIMNDHWEEWKKKFEFRHARVLQSKNMMDEFDVAFVEGAVASEADDDVDPASDRVVGEPGGVASTVGLDDLDVVTTAEAAMDDHGVACRHRRGEGVDHQQDPQAADGTNYAAVTWSHGFGCKLTHR